MTITRKCDLAPHWLPCSVSHDNWENRDMDAWTRDPGHVPPSLSGREGSAIQVSSRSCKGTRILFSMFRTNRGMGIVSSSSTRIKRRQTEGVEGWGPYAKQIGFTSWFCHIPAVWPWANYMLFLYLSALFWVSGHDNGPTKAVMTLHEPEYVKPFGEVPSRQTPWAEVCCCCCCSYQECIPHKMEAWGWRMHIITFSFSPEWEPLKATDW